MNNRMIFRFLLVACCCGVLKPAFAQQSSTPGLKSRISELFASKKDDELLEPDEAFKLKVAFKGTNTLIADLIPAPGYYLYKDRIRFTLKDASGVTIGRVNLPAGEVKTDQFFGKMETYPRPVKAELVLTRAAKAKDLTLIASYQGCHSKLGVCYPPIEKSIKMTLP